MLLVVGKGTLVSGVWLGSVMLKGQWVGEVMEELKREGVKEEVMVLT